MSVQLHAPANLSSENETRYSLNRVQGGSENHFRRFGVEKCKEIDLRFLGRPARSLVNVPAPHSLHIFRSHSNQRSICVYRNTRLTLNYMLQDADFLNPALAVPYLCVEEFYWLKHRIDCCNVCLLYSSLLFADETGKCDEYLCDENKQEVGNSGVSTVCPFVV